VSVATGPDEAVAAARSSLLDRFDALLDQPVGTRSIAVVRMVAGAIAAHLLWPIAADAVHGSTFHDHFFHPVVPGWPVLTPATAAVVLVLGVVAAVATLVGLATRVASATTTTVLGWYLLSSTTHLHNNRAYLFAVLLCVSLAPAGRSWSLDRLVRRRLRRPERPETMAAWPLWLLRFESSLVYAASGVSKLLDPDWFGGTVTWMRVHSGRAMLEASLLPEPVQAVLLDRSFHTFAAKVIVLTELGIAAGLWWRRTRPWALLSAVSFHVAIELSAQVEAFSYLAIGVLVVWADPSLDIAGWRDRVVTRLRRAPVS